MQTSVPPQVMKRKQSLGTVPSTEIAVSRPVGSKPQPGQGMIPPPPASIKTEVLIYFTNLILSNFINNKCFCFSNQK